MNNNLKTKIQRLQNSYWLYWFWYFLLYMETSGGSDSVEYLINEYNAEIRRQNTARNIGRNFSRGERGGDELRPNRFESNRTGRRNQYTTSTPASRRASNDLREDSRRVKIKTSSGHTTYKYEDDLDIGDIILAYMIYDALTGDYNEDPVYQNEQPMWDGFGQGGDANGGGAGGSWTSTDDTISDNYS